MSQGATFQNLKLSGSKYIAMRQMFFISGLLLLSFASCRKETNLISVSGFYTEISPVAGRAQLNFISSKLVIKSETGSNYKDTFSYIISADKILLAPTLASPYSGQQFDFEKIDNNTIKIENLYPGIPESVKSYMTFKK